MLTGVGTALDAGDVGDACGSLAAFTHAVSAQSGKQIQPAQAVELGAAVARIRLVLSC